MAGVLEKRRLRFEAIGDEKPTRYYAVAAVADGHPALDPQFVSLGQVERVRVSTDTKIGRLRRPGKGRDAWRASVPRDQWDHPRHSRTDELLTHQPKTAGQLQGSEHYGYGLESSGSTFDRREDAALALAAWYDGKRRER